MKRTDTLHCFWPRDKKDKNYYVNHIKQCELKDNARGDTKDVMQDPKEENRRQLI